jgi:hypothetical protein
MSIYKNLSLLLTLMLLTILAGCTSLQPGRAELTERCVEWREIGPPAKSTRVRVNDDTCTEARPQS